MHKLTIKLEGIERRKRSTGILHIAAACFLLVKAVDFVIRSAYQNIAPAIPIFLVVVISLVYGFFRKKIDPQAKHNQWVRLMQVVSFTLLGIHYLDNGNGVDIMLVFTWAVICLFLLFTERRVFQDSKMLFTKDGIFIPGYLNNHRIYWDSVKEVVIRQDYITIFQNNDKYVQLEVLSNMNVADENALNLFCNKQIMQIKNIQ